MHRNDSGRHQSNGLSQNNLRYNNYSSQRQFSNDPSSRRCIDESKRRSSIDDARRRQSINESSPSILLKYGNDPDQRLYSNGSKSKPSRTVNDFRNHQSTDELQYHHEAIEWIPLRRNNSAGRPGSSNERYDIAQTQPLNERQHKKYRSKSLPPSSKKQRNQTHESPRSKKEKKSKRSNHREIKSKKSQSKKGGERLDELKKDKKRTSETRRAETVGCLALSNKDEGQERNQDPKREGGWRKLKKIKDKLNALEKKRKKIASDSQSYRDWQAKSLTQKKNSKRQRIDLVKDSGQEYSIGQKFLKFLEGIQNERMLALFALVVVAGSMCGLISALNFGDNIEYAANDGPEGGRPRRPPSLAKVDDPFEGKTSNDIPKWNNARSGLRLSVLNALDDHWDMLFYVATNEWNSGSDALDLEVERIEVDKYCLEERGHLKVCNGDYGPTNWRGVNEILMEDGYIVASVAKLNEYYLEYADDDRRQYTMCHEIGHGLGLGHTDELYNNTDLGNCMDYTDTPENNKRPDESNFKTLRGMYGVLPGNRGRMLRGSDRRFGLKPIPRHVHIQIDKARLELENVMAHTGEMVRSLIDKPSGSKSWNLGNGYELHVEALLV